MNWDAIGAAGEIIGAAAVVVSLLYLAVQMRQSNRLVARAAEKEILAVRADYNKFVASDPKLNELFWKGIDTPELLNEAERQRFLNLYAPMARHLESVYLDIREGFISGRRSEVELASMKRWLIQPGPQEYFSELGDGFDPDFIATVATFREDEDQADGSES